MTTKINFQIENIKSAQEEIDEMTIRIEQSFDELEKRIKRNLIAGAILISLALIFLIFQ